MTLRVGVVGCGLIGNRRAHIAKESGDLVAIVADLDPARAQQVASEIGCEWTVDWREVVGRSDVDTVVVATINNALAPVTIAAAEAGKDVLCEKPLGRNYEEAKLMTDAAQRGGVILKTGFNHRHHPAIWKAYDLCSQNVIGPLMFIRAVYGHGGRPGYDTEWRANAELAGGGELLDQGVHIVDLCRWFMGEFAEVFGSTATYFWNLGSFAETGDHEGFAAERRLEDNAFVVMRTLDGRVAQYHTSWTQWKNCFTFEVFGRDGYVSVSGLGGGYGIETLTVGYRRPESGPPRQERLEFTGPDRSWHDEWQEFTAAIRERRQPLANGEDGLQAMRLIEAIYRSARQGKLQVLAS